MQAVITVLYTISVCVIMYTAVTSRKLTVHTLVHSSDIPYWAGSIVAAWTVAVAAATTILLLPALGAGMLHLVSGYEVRGVYIIQ
jgi:hypothetical protein